MSDNTRDYSSVTLTPREQAYLLHLTQQDNQTDALRVFCRYVGAYNSDTARPRTQPLSWQVNRLRQLAAMPNLIFNDIQE